MGSCNSQQKLPTSSLVPNTNNYDETERKEFRGRQAMNAFVACQMVSLLKEALLFGEVDVQLWYVEELRGIEDTGLFFISPRSQYSSHMCVGGMFL